VLYSGLSAHHLGIPSPFIEQKSICVVSKHVGKRVTQLEEESSLTMCNQIVYDVLDTKIWI